MSEDEKRIEHPDGIVNIIEKILEFNEPSQRGQGIKILTPNQMLSRLPISLAQWKAGNNPEKLKNKMFLLKDILKIGQKKFLLLVKFKIQFHGHMLLVI